MQVDTITFTDHGLAITYMDDKDVRVGGKVIVAHQIQLHHSHPDYREDAARLAALAHEIVRNALDDWAESPPYEKAIDNDDDDRGMGE